MLYPRTVVFVLLLISSLVSAALQNTTIDDQDFSRISYVNASDWEHFPLAGYEDDFYNGTRSYTYVPGAFASFNFTGTGIFLQGPYADDQAKRRVILDGRLVAVTNALASQRSPSAVFWGTRGLENTQHIVIVAHNDTTTKIFAMDAWIVESGEVDTTASGTTAGNTNAARSRIEYPALLLFATQLAVALFTTC